MLFGLGTQPVQIPAKQRPFRERKKPRRSGARAVSRQHHAHDTPPRGILYGVTLSPALSIALPVFCRFSPVSFFAPRHVSPQAPRADTKDRRNSEMTTRRNMFAPLCCSAADAMRIAGSCYLTQAKRGRRNSVPFVLPNRGDWRCGCISFSHLDYRPGSTPARERRPLRQET
jgi:hypothetical protein